MGDQVIERSKVRLGREVGAALVEGTAEPEEVGDDDTMTLPQQRRRGAEHVPGGDETVEQQDARLRVLGACGPVAE